MTVDVAAARVRVPLVRPFTTAAGTWAVRDSWIVRLRDADGRQGVGEAALDPLAGPEALGDLAERVREMVVRVGGAGASISGGLVADLLGDPDALDGPGRAARAAFEAALVDGGWLALVDDSAAGMGARVPLNATIDATDPEAALEGARSAVAAGFATLKLKAPGGEAVEALAGRVAAVRAACGPAVRLRLDANGTWSLGEATARLEALRPSALEYVEQPVATVDEMAALRRRVDVPVAADELVGSPGSAVAILEAGAADVLVVKSARVGGPLVALGIARAAAERGVPTVVSTLLETGVGALAGLRVAAALPRPAHGDGTAHGGRLADLDRPAPFDGPAHGLATTGLLVDDLVVEPPAILDGAVALPWPARAGRVDDAAVRRHAVASAGVPW